MNPMLNSMDHGLAVALALLFPLWGSMVLPWLLKASDAGLSRRRFVAYLGTMTLQCVLTFLLLSLWASNSRDWHALGVVPRTTRGILVAAAILLVVMVPLLRWRNRILSKPDAFTQLEKIARGPGPGRLLPCNSAELACFAALGLSSAITEEVLYRGFLIWYFNHWLLVWVSAALAAVMFGAGHVYQGMRGAAQAAVIGVILAALYIATGSLLIPITVHALVNLHQAHAMSLALRRWRTSAAVAATA